MILRELLPRLYQLSIEEKLKAIEWLAREVKKTRNPVPDDILLSELAGTWTVADEVEFRENTRAFGEVILYGRAIEC